MLKQTSNATPESPRVERRPPAVSHARGRGVSHLTPATHVTDSDVRRTFDTQGSATPTAAAAAPLPPDVHPRVSSVPHDAGAAVGEAGVGLGGRALSTPAKASRTDGRDVSPARIVGTALFEAKVYHSDFRRNPSYDAAMRFALETCHLPPHTAFDLLRKRLAHNRRFKRAQVVDPWLVGTRNHAVQLLRCALLALHLVLKGRLTMGQQSAVMVPTSVMLAFDSCCGAPARLRWLAQELDRLAHKLGFKTNHPVVPPEMLAAMEESVPAKELAMHKIFCVKCERPHGWRKCRTCTRRKRRRPRKVSRPRAAAPSVAPAQQTACAGAPTPAPAGASLMTRRLPPMLAQPVTVNGGGASGVASGGGGAGTGPASTTAVVGVTSSAEREAPPARAPSPKRVRLRPQDGSWSSGTTGAGAVSVQLVLDSPLEADPDGDIDMLDILDPGCFGAAPAATNPTSFSEALGNDLAQLPPRALSPGVAHVPERSGGGRPVATGAGIHATVGPVGGAAAMAQVPGRSPAATAAVTAVAPAAATSGDDENWLDEEMRALFEEVDVTDVDFGLGVSAGRSNPEGSPMVERVNTTQARQDHGSLLGVNQGAVAAMHEGGTGMAPSPPDWTRVTTPEAVHPPATVSVLQDFGSAPLDSLVLAERRAAASAAAYAARRHSTVSSVSAASAAALPAICATTTATAPVLSHSAAPGLAFEPRPGARRTLPTLPVLPVFVHTVNPTSAHLGAAASDNERLPPLDEDIDLDLQLGHLLRGLRW